MGLSLRQLYTSTVRHFWEIKCRRELKTRSEWLPRQIAPTLSPSNQIGVNDYDTHLPLGFEGGFYHRRILMPFLPWADAAMAAGGLPTKATIPLFEIEDLMLSFVVWETAAATARGYHLRSRLRLTCARTLFVAALRGFDRAILIGEHPP